jgi:hypothetical protein
MTNPYRAMCAELLADYDNRHYRSELSDRARALLAQPVAEPLKERPDFIAGYREGLADGRRIIEREESERPAAQPVAVSERLPGPDDCLDEGWAWFFNKRIGWRQAVLPVSTGYTHWLPANALPTPEATND